VEAVISLPGDIDHEAVLAEPSLEVGDSLGIRKKSWCRFPAILG
jgi:hypothetical protein